MTIEKELLNACRREERQAQFELYRQCYGVLMAVSLRYERNKEDADAMVNQIFLKILDNLDRYDGEAPFEAWIRRIAINSEIDEFRRKNRQKLDYHENVTDAAPITAMDYNEADQRFDAEDLENMIRQLPPVSQQVFNLYVVDGFNHKEIAEKLGMSEGTSKWHLSSARKKLKTLVRKMMNSVAILL